MFKNSYQSGLLSIFYSCGSHPLALWEMEVHNGHIRRLTDNEVNSVVLEIVSTNVATTYISCPPNKQYLGIKLPFLVMIVKNLKRYFSFEITILDDKNMRRRFRISNFQSTTKIKPFCTTMPIGLSGGWNQIQFNLSDFTRRAYGTQFIEALRVQVNANVRLRRIYFAERLYTEEELPQDYKLYLPLDKKGKKKKGEPAPAAPPPAEEAGKAPPAETPVEELPAEAKAEERKSTTRKSDAAEAPTSEPEKVEEAKIDEGVEPPQEAEPETPDAPTTPAEEEAPPEGEAPPAEAAPPEGDASPAEDAPTETPPPDAEVPAEAPPEDAEAAAAE